MRMQELLQKRAGLIDQQEKMLMKAHEENRNLTVDEKSTFDNLDKGIADIEEQAEREKRFQEKASDLDKTYNPANFNQEVTQQKSSDEFGSLGEFLVAVAKAGMPYNRIPGAGVFDARLNKSIEKAPSGLSANVPSDGGFLISPTRSNEIMQKTYEGGAILNRCSIFDIGQYSDSLEIPYVNETSRADGSRWGGFRAYREGEVDNATSSKTSIGKWECRVEDIKALVYVTERLLNDAPAMESLIMQLLPQEFTFKLENEILNGTGANQCKGIVGDTATVSVAKESGQASTTLVFENIVKMWTRCWGRSRGNAAWFINQDVEPELFSMVLSAGTGGVPVYLPANGLSQSPYGTLMGRPVVPVEQCQTLGTVGDIILADFSQYALVRKGGLNSASSVHVKFIYDEMTFKFNMRVNGKPKWNNVLAPKNGASNTLSPFVTVATR